MREDRCLCWRLCSRVKKGINVYVFIYMNATCLSGYGSLYDIILRFTSNIFCLLQSSISLN